MPGSYNCLCYFGFTLNDEDRSTCEIGNLLISFDFVQIDIKFIVWLLGFYVSQHLSVSNSL